MPVDVAVLVAVEVVVAVAVAVAVVVAVAVAVEVAVEVGLESITSVCVSDASGNTIQLVPSEIASNVPPINSLGVPKPMLSAVKLLKTTSPSSAPETTML